MEAGAQLAITEGRIDAASMDGEVQAREERRYLARWERKGKRREAEKNEDSRG